MAWASVKEVDYLVWILKRRFIHDFTNFLRTTERRVEKALLDSLLMKKTYSWEGEGGGSLLFK